MIYSALYPSPIGTLTLECDDSSLVGVWLEGQKYREPGSNATLRESDDAPILKAAKAWLDGYFAGKAPDVSALPLAPVGSDFRREVWRLLCDIPYGTVVTYGDIAKKMAAWAGKAKMSAQAVGGAVGHNPISIIIPCHRVVGANGSLTGYGGGIARKIKLLQHEGVDTSRLFAPKKGTAL
ncbi:MAG: methylated-DNA--[protein]-cysteine S-methyltransferase [Oscillospiraceae bacterium]|jgi:methylated-DNA-[protein]-cysteine S-methyltransferase|nr:methylated-DNA--[protein]-cysteine S-methyltransferase [Oscillospiraceae bacterium]